MAAEEKHEPDAKDASPAERAAEPDAARIAELRATLANDPRVQERLQELRSQVGELGRPVVQ